MLFILSLCILFFTHTFHGAEEKNNGSTLQKIIINNNSGKVYTYQLKETGNYENGSKFVYFHNGALITKKTTIPITAHFLDKSEVITFDLNNAFLHEQYHFNINDELAKKEFCTMNNDTVEMNLVLAIRAINKNGFHGLRTILLTKHTQREQEEAPIKYEYKLKKYDQGFLNSFQLYAGSMSQDITKLDLTQFNFKNTDKIKLIIKNDTKSLQKIIFDANNIQTFFIQDGSLVHYVNNYSTINHGSNCIIQ